MKMNKLYLSILLFFISGIVISNGCAKRVTTTQIGEEMKPPLEISKVEEPEVVTEPVIAPAEIKEEVIPVEPVKEVAQLKVTTPPVAMKDVNDVYFDFDRYVIREDARKVLQDNAGILKGTGYKKIVIEGHCDERGTTDYNLALGERRAESTKRYLTALGVNSSKIATISYGEEKPFCLDHNEECWQQNRRAHFVVE